MAPQKSSSDLPAPLRAPVTALRRVPGAGVVTKVADGALDAVGTVSPRGRRVAVYTGAGLLGVAGVVEWPIALTVAGVAWLTQPKPRHEGDGAAATTGAATTRARTTAAKRTAARSSTAKRATSSRGSGKAATAGGRPASTGTRTASSRGKAAAGARSSAGGSRRKATTSGG
ncbi:hypothetical protein ACWCPM_15930 [Streptomyces sp. NPDC002309]